MNRIQNKLVKKQKWSLHIFGHPLILQPKQEGHTNLNSLENTQTHDINSNINKKEKALNLYRCIGI